MNILWLGVNGVTILCGSVWGLYALPVLVLLDAAPIQMEPDIVLSREGGH